MRAETRRKAFGYLREKRVNQVRHDQPNQTRPARGERPSCEIRLIIHFLHAAQHALARLRADVGVVVQHLGDRNY